MPTKNEKGCHKKPVNFDSLPEDVDLSNYEDKTMYSQFHSTKDAQRKLLMDVTEAVEILDVITNDVIRCELLDATKNMGLIWNPLCMMSEKLIQLVELVEPFINFEEEPEKQA